MAEEINLEEMSESELALTIQTLRNIPYTLKIERIDGNKIYCRNSWSNHAVYIYKDNTFYLENELE